jgi:hypothetical protein
MPLLSQQFDECSPLVTDAEVGNQASWEAFGNRPFAAPEDDVVAHVGESTPAVTVRQRPEKCRPGAALYWPLLLQLPSGILRPVSKVHPSGGQDALRRYPRSATYRGITFATTTEAARAVALTAWGSVGSTSRAAWPKRAAKASLPSGSRSSPPSTWPCRDRMPRRDSDLPALCDCALTVSEVADLSSSIRRRHASGVGGEPGAPVVGSSSAERRLG